MEVSLPYVYLLVLIISAWSVVGGIRGGLPEAVNLAGILFSWLIMARVGDSILELANRLTRVVLFLVRGGIDSENPAALVRSLSGARLVDTNNPEVGRAVLFAAIVALFFLLATRFAPRRLDTTAKVLGSALGALNGYVAAYIAFQNPSPNAVLVIDTGLPATRSLDPFLPSVSGFIIAVVGLIIIVGLTLSVRAWRHANGTQFAARKRS